MLWLKKEKVVVEVCGLLFLNLMNKLLKVFGMIVGYDNFDEVEKKLMRLWDMGF